MIFQCRKIDIRRLSTCTLYSTASGACHCFCRIRCLCGNSTTSIRKWCHLFLYSLRRSLVLVKVKMSWTRQWIFRSNCAVILHDKLCSSSAFCHISLSGLGLLHFTAFGVSGRDKDCSNHTFLDSTFSWAVHSQLIRQSYAGVGSSGKIISLSEIILFQFLLDFGTIFALFSFYLNFILQPRTGLLGQWAFEWNMLLSSRMLQLNWITLLTERRFYSGEFHNIVLRLPYLWVTRTAQNVNTYTYSAIKYHKIHTNILEQRRVSNSRESLSQRSLVVRTLLLIFCSS